MKNKPVLSLGVKAKDILEYISKKTEVSASEIYKKFNLQGNGIFLRQLNKKGFIEKIRRGRYAVRATGKKLLEVVDEMEAWIKNERT